MAVKRIVSTSFWLDDKVLDLYSPEDKYFMLYLLTNPRTSQLGIYKLPKKIISFETGYTSDSIKVLIDRFEAKYKNIKYNQETQEIAILNSLKHSIIKGGKPVEDLLKKELSKVENCELIELTYNNMLSWWNRSVRKFDETVKELFEEELKKRNIIFNDNDNDNEESCNDSCSDSSKKKKENKTKEKKKYFDNEKVNDVFIEFLKLRTSLKAKNTDRAVNMLLNKLKPYDDDYKIELMEESIVNSWKSIFPKKQTKENNFPSWFEKEIKEDLMSDEEIEKLKREIAM